MAVLIITVLGFSTKFYHGAGQEWVNDSLGGMFYVIFWCIIVYLFFPQTAIKNIVAIVFITTCGIEALQLWHPPFLEWVRGFFLGRTLLGNSFSFSDILHYAAAGIISIPFLNYLKKREASN